MARDKIIVMPIRNCVRTKDELQRLFPGFPSQPFLAKSRNAPTKETGAHIGTTFLSRNEPISVTVSLSGTVSSDMTNNTSCFINALNHHKYAGPLLVFLKRPR